MSRSRIHIIACALAIIIVKAQTAAAATAAEQDLLLRWPAHEGNGARVQDASGGGLDGLSAAGWTGEGGVKALFFDGQPKAVVRVQVPEGKALGAGDWTFMAWLRPEVLGFPGKQDQRRIFNYGKYPDASINLDVTGQGALSWYCVYKQADGKSVSAGGSSSPRIKPKTWLHAALVMDRRNGRMTAYLNGRESGQSNLPQGWAGNFNLGNELTIGSAWQNFHGAMADVALWRRALNEVEVKTAFGAQCGAYSVKLGDGLSVEEALGDLSEEGSNAMAQKKTQEARAAFEKMLATSGAPPAWAAWAELRIAQSLRLDGDESAAKEVYKRIQSRQSYLPHHRQEAAELIEEMERTAKGLPARDVAASRTALPEIARFAAEIWVAPDGDDANPGVAARPVATLARARDLARHAGRDAGAPSGFGRCHS
ncbi:MAG: LamG domain-containing protein [Candidatus Sumerlaeota bacterium]|nr:LamG domain-containing protein [Candidatus Sumerlaeota bacterium]